MYDCKTCPLFELFTPNYVRHFFSDRGAPYHATRLPCKPSPLEKGLQQEEDSGLSRFKTWSSILPRVRITLALPFSSLARLQQTRRDLSGWQIQGSISAAQPVSRFTKIVEVIGAIDEPVVILVVADVVLAEVLALLGNMRPEKTGVR